MKNKLSNEKYVEMMMEFILLKDRNEQMTTNLELRKRIEALENEQFQKACAAIEKQAFIFLMILFQFIPEDNHLRMYQTFQRRILEIMECTQEEGK